MPRKSDDPAAIPCSRCGYDLRVTPLDAMCPECGLPVVQSKPGYRVEGDMLVVYPKANLPKQYRRAAMPAPMLAQGTTLHAAPFLQGPMPQKMSFIAASMWWRAIAYSVPIVMTLAIIIFPPVLHEARLLSAPAADDSGILVLPVLVLGMLLAAVVLRLAGKECKLVIYTSVLGMLADAGMLLVAAVWFVVSVIFTGTITTRAYDLLGTPGAGLALAIGLSVAIGGTYRIHRGASIRVVRHEHGEFYLKGFSAGYLQTCVNVRQRIHDEARAIEASMTPPMPPAPPAGEGQALAESPDVSPSFRGDRV